MLSYRYQDMQHQATNLEEIAKQTGLLINPQKKKTMRINTTQTDKLTIRDTEVENVEQKGSDTSLCEIFKTKDVWGYQEWIFLTAEQDIENRGD